ncbi:MAG: FecR family protein [Chromatiales bacterium]
MSHKIVLSGAAFLVCLFGAVGSEADTAGKVVYAYGEAQLVDAAGQSHPVRKGEEVATGQTLVTENGRMQVRFADGGFIAVQPDTQFKIDEYHYAGVEDGSERSIFNLVKGGIRFVTGAIGHKNNQNYKIKTTVATIGIRGTAGRLLMCVAGSCAALGLPDGLHAISNEGKVTQTNGTGTIDMTVGQNYHTACDTCSPRETTLGTEGYVALDEGGGFDEASSTEAGTAPPDFVAGNEFSSDGTPSPITGGQLAVSLTAAHADTTFGNVFSYVNVALDGLPPSVVDGTWTVTGQNEVFTLGTARTEDFFSNGVLFAFRWTGGTYSDVLAGTTIFDGPLTGHQSLHQIYGVTSDASPSLGFATYDFIPGSATHSTNQSGSTIGEGIIDGQLVVNFTQATVDVSMTVRHLVDYSVVGQGSLTDNFAGIYSASVSNDPTICIDGCPTQINGFLAGSTQTALGPTPSHAGLAYRIDTFSDAIYGVGGFGLSTAGTTRRGTVP